MLFFLDNEFLVPELAAKATSGQARHSSHYSLHESDKALHIEMDLPGVKIDNISVKHAKKVLVISSMDDRFSKSVPVDPKKFEIDSIKATLTDGVLSIQLPKHAPFEVPVTSCGPPESNDGKFCLTVDLPGVKVDNLEVSVADNTTMSIDAKRSVGSSTRCISRKALIDGDKIDIKHMKGYLNDGVLTIEAPQRPKADPKEIKVETEETSFDDSHDRFSFSLDLPGVKATDVSIKVKDDEVLHIVASRSFQNKTRQFTKEVMLDDRVRRSELHAELVHGVLTISAPRDPEPEPVVIPVTAGQRSNPSKPIEEKAE